MYDAARDTWDDHHLHQPPPPHPDQPRANAQLGAASPSVCLALSTELIAVRVSQKEEEHSFRSEAMR